MKNQTTYDRKVIAVYDGELHAIDEMLTEADVPTAFDNSDDPIPTRMRVRWLIDQYRERGAALRA